MDRIKKYNLRHKRKKAIYLSLITIMLISLFILLLRMNAKLSFSEVDDLKQQRVENINRLINDIKIDGERALYISSYRTMIAMIENIKKYQNEGLDSESDAKDIFKQIIIEGKADTKDLESMEETAADGTPVKQTLDEWHSRMKTELSKIDLDFTLNPPSGNIDVTDISLTYKTPFILNIDWDVTFLLKDKIYPEVNWQFHHVFHTELNIQGFEDPLYVIGSNGRYSNNFSITPYSEFEDAGSLLDTELRDHIKNHYYKQSSVSPDYFQRFVRKKNYPPFPGYVNNDNGIESFVYVPDLFEQDREERVVLDHIYMHYDDPDPSLHPKTIDGLGYESWFIIDDDIASRYGISSSNLVDWTES